VSEHLVAVVDCLDVDEPRLGRLSANVATRVSSGRPTPDQVVDRAEGATVLATLYTYTSVGEDVIERLPDLQLVATRTAGYSHIAVDAAAARGVGVVSVPSAPTMAVAEYTIGALMMGRRRLAEAAASTAAGNWDYTGFKGSDLAGNTLGVIGLGSIGTRVAELALAIGMNVLAWSRGDRRPPGVERVGLDELLERSDMVSVNVALTPETNGLLDAERLASMRRGAWLVNTARGEVLDTDALCALLESGHLGGACLDVVDGEPLEPERARRLAAVPNLILTPHIAWLTDETLDRQFAGMTDAILAFCDGRQIELVRPPDPTPRRLP
jgi:phosphoglycerate dehydrogenase-like enzyme